MTILILIFSVVDISSFESNAQSEPYYISSDVDYISFGQINRGDYQSYQEIRIYNDDTQDMRLMWSVADPDNILIVDAPNDEYLAVGNYSDFYVNVDSFASEGSHTAYLYVARDDDPSYTYGICVKITVIINANTPTVTAVKVSPSTVTLTNNSSVSFMANVEGRNDYSSAVTWEVTGQKGSTYIDSKGNLNVAANETASTLTVKATSAVDQSVYGTATVNIKKDMYVVNGTANPSNGGTVSGGGSVTKGDNITLTASPYSGYQFVRWTLNGKEVSTKAQYTVSNVTNNMNYVAEFSQVSYKVRVTSNRSYGGSVSGDANVTAGKDVTVSASAYPGYRFEGWYENNTKLSSDVKYTVKNVKEDHNLIGVFEATKFTVAAQVNTQGAGTIAGAGSFNPGENVTLKATPSSGYSFAGWFLNGTEYSKSAEIKINNINKDYSFVAYFMKQNATTYILSSNVNTKDGTISPEGDFVVPQGTNATYTITPKAGFQIADVKVDNVSVGAVNSYTFSNVSATHTITAYFSKKPEAPEHNENHQDTVKPDVDNKKSSSDNVQVDGSDDYSRNTADYDLDYETGILQKYNLTDSEAIALIRSGNGSELFEEALADGTFEISIFYEIGDETNFVQDIANADVAIPNIREVLREVFTDDDLLAILHSQRVVFSINLFSNSDYVSEEDKAMLNSALTSGMELSDYFDISILKTIDGETTNITSLSTPMTFVIKLPDEMKGDGRRYYVLSTNGYGDTRIIADEDSNPDTITFSTDTFDSFALAHTSPIVDRQNDASANDEKKGNKSNAVLVLIGAIAGLVAVLGIANVIVAKRK